MLIKYIWYTLVVINEEVFKFKEFTFILLHFKGIDTNRT